MRLWTRLYGIWGTWSHVTNDIFFILKKINSLLAIYALMGIGNCNSNSVTLRNCRTSKIQNFAILCEYILVCASNNDKCQLFKL